MLADMGFSFVTWIFHELMFQPNWILSNHSPDDDQSILIETSSCNLQFFFRTNCYSVERISHGVTASCLSSTYQTSIANLVWIHLVSHSKRCIFLVFPCLTGNSKHVNPGDGLKGQYRHDQSRLPTRHGISLLYSHWLITFINPPTFGTI